MQPDTIPELKEQLKQLISTQDLLNLTLQYDTLQAIFVELLLRITFCRFSMAAQQLVLHFPHSHFAFRSVGHRLNLV